MTLKRYMELQRNYAESIAADNKHRTAAEQLADYFQVGEAGLEFAAGLRLSGETSFWAIANSAESIELDEIAKSAIANR